MESVKNEMLSTNSYPRNAAAHGCVQRWLGNWMHACLSPHQWLLTAEWNILQKISSQIHTEFVKVMKV